LRGHDQNFMALQKEGKDTTEIAVIIELQNQEGLGKPLLCTGFWRGVSADLYQGVLNAALMMMVKEQLTITVKGIVLSVLGSG
jgi:hypothetical protein